MKILFELLPVIVFFAAFKLAQVFPAEAAEWARRLPGDWTAAAGAGAVDLVPIAIATALAILATIVQVGWLLARGKEVKPMLWVSAVLIVVFGGLTLWLHNEWFIKWKPTLLYAAFAAVLLGGRLLGRNLLGSVLGSELALPPAAWDRLLYAWSALFALLGVVNIAVAYAVSTSAWVDFKTFGLPGLTLVASIGTGLYVARFIEPSPSPAPADAVPEAGRGAERAE